MYIAKGSVWGGWGAKLDDFRVKNNLITTPVRHTQKKVYSIITTNLLNVVPKTGLELVTY